MSDEGSKAICEVVTASRPGWPGRRARRPIGALVLGAALLAANAAGEDRHVFLIGDAGDPGNAPVLKALRNEASEDATHSLVVFLGDNIYPRGLPAPGAPDRPEAERLIHAQIDAVRGAGARGLVIPGNHDWARHTDEGWDAVRRQAKYVEQEGGGAVDFLPKGGCPGPAVLDVSDSLRLVALDTHWWLHGGPKPEGPDSGCPAATEEAVVSALREALAGAGQRRVLVVSHHPLLSGGGHGGHFSWKDHVFPLRAWKGWFWLPLPVLGSAYPLGREAGMFSQDITADGYRHMADLLQGAVADRPPLVWAAGHDHGLQVLDGGASRYTLVSGAGAVGHTSTPERIDATRYRSGAAGFMRLDFQHDETQLSVLTVDGRGRVTERFRLRLE